MKVREDYPMKEFKFKLNKVLEVKKIELKQQQKVLSDAAKKKLEAYQAMEQQQNAASSFASRLKTITQHSAGALNIYYDYYHHLLDEAKQKEMEMYQLAEMEEQERQRLISVQKEQKVLEKLKEHEQEKFLDDISKNDQNSLDEIAVIRFFKNRKG